ncbi:MAG TPA: hypothetical protein VKR42_01620 [Ktedonobacteraceae bacterium]|nr:hypothetical protein [Ktedonobacteraceae bacterium]
MFEAVLTLTATIGMDENEQATFQVYQREGLEYDFLSPLAIIYYEEVYRLLNEGDTLIVTMRTYETERVIIADLRDGPEDYVFVEAGYAYTPDLFPRIEEVYQEFLSHFRNESTLSVIFQVKRL